ncbi:MAG: hypothetical protein K0R68_2228 [Mycobacterium sp.]|nr:hypothetical protein [Mycobacterium sp.]
MVSRSGYHDAGRTPRPTDVIRLVLLAQHRLTIGEFCSVARTLPQRRCNPEAPAGAGSPSPGLARNYQMVWDTRPSAESGALKKGRRTVDRPWRRRARGTARPAADLRGSPPGRTRTLPDGHPGVPRQRLGPPPQTGWLRCPSRTPRSRPPTSTSAHAGDFSSSWWPCRRLVHERTASPQRAHHLSSRV